MVKKIKRLAYFQGAVLFSVGMSVMALPMLTLAGYNFLNDPELTKYVPIDPYLFVLGVVAAFPMVGFVLGLIWVTGANITLKLFGGLSVQLVDVELAEKKIKENRAVLKGKPKQSKEVKASPPAENTNTFEDEPVLPLEAAPQPISMN